MLQPCLEENVTFLSSALGAAAFDCTSFLPSSVEDEFNF